MLEGMLNTYDNMNIKDAWIVEKQGESVEELVDVIIAKLNRLLDSKTRLSCRNVLVANFETMTKTEHWLNSKLFADLPKDLGELPLERLTDHVYDLCELSAQEAEAADDHVLDYLRKRAVFYATWLTVPRIIGRQYEQFKKTGQLEINDDDLKFSTLIYDAVIYFQDHFFGQMLQDSWDNAAREYVPRRKNSKNADAYRDLPETFTKMEVMAVLDIESDAANKQCQRWLKHGFVERVKQGKYKKVIKEIMI